MRIGRAEESDRARMTGFTRQVSGKMVAWLAKRSNVIVASSTAGGNSGVVHLYPDGVTHRGLVAHFAWRGGRDMGRRLAGRGRTVVTTRAIRIAR